MCNFEKLNINNLIVAIATETLSSHKPAATLVERMN